MTATYLSVVVPVYNEAALIVAAATALLDGLPEAAEVVFACNGCSDESAKLLRETVGSRCLVLDIAVAGKANAIREAEKHVDGFPRFYVDSDVVVRGDGLVRMAEELARRDLDLVSPRIQFDVQGSTWAARAVSGVWLALPHGASGGFHAVLGVSRRGRAGWAELPDLMGDDAFIECHVRPDRKAIIQEVVVITRPPRTLWSFIKVRERWLRGHKELSQRGITPPKVRGQRRALSALAGQAGQTLPVVLYIAARLIAQFLSMLPSQKSPNWYRDATSR